MRNGEHNGSVRVYETRGNAETVIEAIRIEFGTEEYTRKYPRCFLYNQGVAAFVKIQYNTLIHYLVLAEQSSNFSVKVERDMASGRPVSVYVR
jgi:hypothetical protein